MSEEDEIVDSLVKRSFSSRSMAYKKYIIERGRSTPDLKTREGMRNFRPQCTVCPAVEKTQKWIFLISITSAGFFKS